MIFITASRMMKPRMDLLSFEEIAETLAWGLSMSRMFAARSICGTAWFVPWKCRELSELGMPQLGLAAGNSGGVICH